MTERSVQDYALPADKTEQLLSYPFSRPEGSFITDGNEVTLVADDFADFQTEADEYLAAHALPPLADRIPVISYGANSNPVRLAEKMATFANNGNALLQPALQTVPNLIATVPDAMVAWHGKPGQAGSTFAELYEGPETVGHESKVHLSFMTPLQLALLHASEGVTYHLARLDVLAGNDKQPIEAVVYVAGNSEILLKDGYPIPVKRIAEDNEPTAMTAEEAVDYMLAEAGDTVGAHTARELIAETTGLKLVEKKDRQAKVSARLGELGMSKQFSFPVGTYIGRADFNTLTRQHNVLHLAEEVLAPMRPKSEEVNALAQDIAATVGSSQAEAIKKARKQLDVVEAIRQRAVAELIDRDPLLGPDGKRVLKNV